MIVPGSLKLRPMRRFLRWLAVLLAIVLLTGFGSDAHGQDCPCDNRSTEICQVCELHHLESAMIPAVEDLGTLALAEPAYALATSNRLVVTDLDRDHPPPELGVKG